MALFPPPVVSDTLRFGAVPAVAETATLTRVDRRLYDAAGKCLRRYPDYRAVADVLPEVCANTHPRRHTLTHSHARTAEQTYPHILSAEV